RPLTRWWRSLRAARRSTWSASRTATPGIATSFNSWKIRVGIVTLCPPMERRRLNASVCTRCQPTIYIVERNEMDQWFKAVVTAYGLTPPVIRAAWLQKPEALDTCVHDNLHPIYGECCPYRRLPGGPIWKMIGSKLKWKISMPSVSRWLEGRAPLADAQAA